MCVYNIMIMQLLTHIHTHNQLNVDIYDLYKNIESGAKSIAKSSAGTNSNAKFRQSRSIG